MPSRKWGGDVPEKGEKGTPCMNYGLIPFDIKKQKRGDKIAQWMIRSRSLPIFRNGKSRQSPKKKRREKKIKPPSSKQACFSKEGIAQKKKGHYPNRKSWKRRGPTKWREEKNRTEKKEAYPGRGGKGKPLCRDNLAKGSPVREGGALSIRRKRHCKDSQ